jgi:O-antigen ligase
MIALNHKMIFGLGAFVLWAFTIIAAYLSQPLLLTVPILLLALFYLIQYPQVLLYVLLFSIPWSTEYNFSINLATDLPDEPLMLLMAVAITCMIVFHRKTLLVQNNFHPLILLLLLQFVWLLLTVILSSLPILSVKYLLAKSWYLLAFVAAPVLLWKDEKVFKHSVIILVMSMLGVTALTLYRHASFDFTFSTINPALKPFFRNHVNYSALLVFMLPLQVACWQLAKTKMIRWLILLSFLITVPALYFSFARGAWLAAIAGFLAYWLLKKKWLFQSFLFTIVVVIALVFRLRQNNRYLEFAHDYQSTVFHQNFGEHLEATYQLKDLSTAERFHRWIAGVRMVEDGWQTGFGPSTFYSHYKSYTVPAFKTWVSRNEEQSTVHNYFLLLLVEQGIIALLLFLCLIGGLFWYAQKIYHRTANLFWKRTIAAIAMILVMQCTLNFLSDLVETDKVGSVFYLCVAALIIADLKTRAALNHRLSS